MQYASWWSHCILRLGMPCPKLWHEPFWSEFLHPSGSSLEEGDQRSLALGVYWDQIGGDSNISTLHTYQNWIVTTCIMDCDNLTYMINHDHFCGAICTLSFAVNSGSETIESKESASQSSVRNQHPKVQISGVKDDLGSTSWMNGRDGRDRFL